MASAVRSPTPCVDMQHERCDGDDVYPERIYMLAPAEQKTYYGKLYFEVVMGHVCY